MTRVPSTTVAVAALLVCATVGLTLLGSLREHFALFAVIAVSATAILYLFAARRDGGGASIASSTVLGVALLLRLAALPMEPTLSDDVWRYLWDGRVSLAGENPYLLVPGDSVLAHLHPPLLALQGHPETPTVYPPVAQLLFALAALPARGNDGHITAYYLWKSLLVALELAGVWLLLRVLASCGTPLRWGTLYAWHPLAVVEVAGQGHLDGLWVAALAAALWCYRTRGGGIGWLAAGTMFRLYPVVLLPLWSRTLGMRRTIWGLLVSAPLVLLTLPLLEPGALASMATVVARFTNYYEFNGGFYYGVKWLFDLVGVVPSNRAAGLVSTLAQLLVAAIAFIAARRAMSFDRLVALSLAVTSAVVALGAKSHTWYYVAPLVLVALDPRTPLARAWLWIAMVAPLTYAAYTVTPVRESPVILAIEWGGAVILAIATLYAERSNRSAVEGVPAAAPVHPHRR